MSSKPMYCPQCGALEKPETRVKGDAGAERVFWIVGLCALPFGVGAFILIGAFFYSTWRRFSGHKTCRVCAHAGIVPADSPAARHAWGTRPEPSRAPWNDERSLL